MENELNSTSIDLPDGFIDGLKSDPHRAIFTDEALVIILKGYLETLEYESDRSNLYDQLCACVQQYNFGTVVMAVVVLFSHITKEEMDFAYDRSISLFTESMLFYYTQLFVKCDTNPTIVDSLIGTMGKIINRHRKIVVFPVLVYFLKVFVKISLAIKN
jgi:hypothetical protein